MIDFRLEQRDFVSPWLAFFAPICAVLFSLVVASILILLAGVSPLESYYKLFVGAFGSKNAIAETLARATPIILTGLAAAIAFRAKFWNIGGTARCT